MTLIGFRASNHPQQVDAHGAARDVDDRATTPDLFGPLNDRFGFTLDVAASAANTKCDRYFTLEDNGLTQPWADEIVWCNPPYSDIRPWVLKAWHEWRHGCDAIAMLLPANRTEQSWWQDLTEPYRDQSSSPLTVEFMRGRFRFLAPGQTRVGPNERPPFGMALCIWRHRSPALERQEVLAL